MKKNMLKLNISFIIILVSILLVNIVNAKDLNYEFTVNYNIAENKCTLRYSTFVKAADGAVARNKGKFLEDKKGSKTTYQTNAILLHTNYTSNYSSISDDKLLDNKKMEVGYDKSDDSHMNLSTLNIKAAAGGVASKYYDVYYNNVRVAYTKITSNNDDKGTSVRIDGKGAKENSTKIYGDLMISDFELSDEASEKVHDEFINQEIEGNVLKVHVSNLLNMNVKGKSKTFESAYEFYDHVSTIGFDRKNWGGSQYVGQSALNNYDNNAYIPSDPTKREVYVRYIVQKEDGTQVSLNLNEMGDHAKEYNGKFLNVVYNSEKGYIENQDGYNWAEKYILTKNDDSIEYVPSSYINQDLIDKQRVMLSYGFDDKSYGPFTPTSLEDTKVKNVGSATYTYITYYIYPEKKDLNEYNILVRHVDSSTTDYKIIPELCASERVEGFSDALRILTYPTNSDYQSVWKVNAHQNGSVKANEFFDNTSGLKYNINGVLYELESKVTISGGENASEAVANLQKGNVVTNSGNFVNSNSLPNIYNGVGNATYIITFYYKQVCQRKLYVNHILFGQDKILYDLTDSERILDDNNQDLKSKLTKIIDKGVYTSGYYFGSDIDLNVKANESLENNGTYQKNGKKYKLKEIHIANGKAGDGETDNSLDGALYNATQKNDKYFEYKNVYDQSGQLVNCHINQNSVSDTTIVSFYYEEIGSVNDKNNTLYLGHYINQVSGNVQTVKGSDLEMSIAGSATITGDFENSEYDEDDEYLLGISDNSAKAKYDYYENLTVKVNSPTKIGNKSYTCYGYIYGEIGDPRTFIFTNKVYEIKSNSTIDISLGSNKNNYKFIVFLYRSGSDGGALTDLTFNGYLDFINNDSKFEYATNNPDLNPNTADNIPSGEKLRPYVKNAYPYIVRGLNYEVVTKTENYECKVTYKCHYYYQPPTPEGAEEPPEPEEGDEEVDKTFRVNVSFTYYKLKNFKMYKISELVIKNDDDSLFSGDEAVIGVSDSYNNRFKRKDGKKAGINNLNNNWNFDRSVFPTSKEIEVGDLEGKSNDARTYLDNYMKNVSQVISDAELSIGFSCSNDYVYLDGKDDMLDANIQKYEGSVENDNTSITLDSTDGGKCKYTNNLMNYMKPSKDYLTDYGDFDGEITILGENSTDKR